MTVRPIDANAMLNELKPVSFEAEHSAVLLSDVSKMMREWVERQPTLTPPNEWMSVEDELPARDGVYLVFTMRGSVATAHFYAEKTFSDGYRRSANWQGNRKVTHWMPLPAPPDRRPPEGEEDT